MPKGRPGDNPLTDILHARPSEVGEPVDGMVRATARSGRFVEVRDAVERVPWDCSPVGRHAERTALVAAAIDRLAALRRSIDGER